MSTASEAVGPLVMIDLPGPALDEAWREHIRKHRIRAVCLFSRNLPSSAEARALVADLQGVMGPAAIVAIDQEGGSVWRSRDLPFAPSAMSLGASDDIALAESVGAATARGLRAMGINWNFAPVLDLNSNPRNPVIGDRSFGGEPARAAALALAWARGSQGEGVATCVKHFPGHGDTHLDSHLALPTVDKELSALADYELLPFREAAKSDVPAFMSAHIRYPAFDAEHPATLSRPVLTGLLREAWGYDGLIITDSMDMLAIADHYGRDEAAVMAARAGADMVMALGSMEAQEETLAALSAARHEGRLEAAALARSLARLDAFAARYPVRARPYHESQREADQRLMREAWARGLSIVGAARPVARGAPVLLLAARETPGENVSEPGLAGAALAKRLEASFALTPVFYERRAPEAACGELQAALAGFDREQGKVVFASTSRHRLSEAEAALARLAAPDLHLALWNPYCARDVAAPALLAYGFRAEALLAVQAWLEGRSEASGRVPVRLEA